MYNIIATGIVARLLSPFIDNNNSIDEFQNNRSNNITEVIFNVLSCNSELYYTMPFHKNRRELNENETTESVLSQPTPKPAASRAQAFKLRVGRVAALKCRRVYINI